LISLSDVDVLSGDLKTLSAVNCNSFGIINFLPWRAIFNPLSSTNTNCYIPINVGAGRSETLNLPEDGVLYATRSGPGIVDGIGITGNTSALAITLFIDK